MKSFGILRTNPGLTTNLKIMVGSNYKLSIDSIDSAPELSASKYKNVEFNKDNYFDELVPYFYDGLPAEIAFQIKYDDDSNSMTQNFADQYDEIYQYGARNIINNKNYTEEFEYFAPLYAMKGRLPKYFVIFRVDGPGITKVDRTNFKEQITKKFKTVSLFDLTKKTALGEWLDKNIEDNEFFPNTPFEMNYDALEFSVWKGINYVSGGYVDRSQFLDDSVEEEKEVFEMEKFIFDGYKKNKVVFPNILNLSFLFDDTPADVNSIRKWSINRYYGFYLQDIELVTTISPYSTPRLKADAVVLTGNILSSKGDPFVDGFRTDVPMYVEYNGEYYAVERFTEKSLPTVSSVKSPVGSSSGPTVTKGPNVQISSASLIDINDPTTQDYKKDEIVEIDVEKWRIISDIDLSGKQAELNLNSAIFGSDKRLVTPAGKPFEIVDFDRYDIWMIEIDGKFHNLSLNSSGEIVINTDYGFSFSDNSYSYFINSQDPKYSKTVSTLVDFNNKPKKFPIYRARMSSIKDFDTRIVDTEPSKFEYEKIDQITKTEETKLYFTDLNSLTIPQRLDNFNYRDEVVNIPVSSEYTSNQETFKIDDGELSPIWRKNSVYCRWAYEGSLSANDYPYTLNNSSVFEEFNRTTNTYDSDPSRVERNLDYFYTINSSTHSYVHHSLHVQNTDSDGIDKKFDFDFDSYFGLKKLIDPDGNFYLSDLDYFEYFFTKKTGFEYDNNVKNTRKFSEFLAGDEETPNQTVFRGIKFSIYDVENIKLNTNGRIETINTSLNNTFEDWKFSIILTSSDNGMRWDIVEKWDLEKQYAKDDIVVFDDILYIARANTICTVPYLQKTRTANDTNQPVKVVPTPYTMMAYSTSFVSPGGSRLLNTLEFDDKKSDVNQWLFYNVPEISGQPTLRDLFWNPVRATEVGPLAYKNFDVIYRHGSYYYMADASKAIDFWNPVIAMKTYVGQKLFNGFYSATKPDQRPGYKSGSIVYHRDNFYVSKSDGNIMPPNDSSWEIILTSDEKQYFKWTKVEVWQPNKQYGGGFSIVIHDDVLYRSTNNTDLILSGTTPGTSPQWTRMYSFSPDTNIIYTNKVNPYIMQNGELYRMVTNPRSQTLENGVRVFVNHRYKNVLVNIFVNDNTTNDLKNADRDLLYRKINSKFVAKNFIDHINSVSSKNGFSDFLTYYVIGTDGTMKTYSYANAQNSITTIPHIMFAEGPEEVEVQPNSLEYLPVNEIRLKPTKALKASRITSLSEIDYYNNTHMGVEIIQTDDTPTVFNINPKNKIYRFSGNYMPLFYEVELFNKSNSVQFSSVNLMFEISDAQNVVFDLKNFGSGSQSTYKMYPGKSYSTSIGYYKQVVDVMKERLEGLEFSYEIKEKNRPLLGTETLALDDTTYDTGLSLWYNQGKSEAFAKPIVSTASPVFVNSDLYPGNYLTFDGSSESRSAMVTSQVRVGLLNNTFEFVLNSDDVDKLNYFMGNSYLNFGFEGGRVFFRGIISQVYRTVYSRKILQPKTWYHIVFTLSTINTGNFVATGSELSKVFLNVYIDGVNQTETTLPVPSGVSFTHTTSFTTNIQEYGTLSTFGIGTKSDLSNTLPPYFQTFRGKMSSIRFHDVFLTNEKIYSSFVNLHKVFSVRYRSDKANISLSLKPEYPKLILNISDTFDPLYQFFALQMGATGGNEPYEYSFNGSNFSATTTYLSIPKNGSYKVIVKDVLGLTSSLGYYTINSVIEEKYDILNGNLLY